MKDRRSIDELSIEEIEELLRVRRAEARLERLRKRKGPVPAVDPLAPGPTPPPPAPLPDSHRQFPEEGASAGFRARSVDGAAAPRPRRERAPLRIHWRWLRDKSLLVLEIAVVFSLVIILLGIWETQQELNRMAQEVQQSQLPTPTPITPTPVVQVALLPSGHTPPGPSGDSAPQPVPAHLRDWVAAITPVPAPTPGPEQATRIRIPGIAVDAPVIEGDDWESLKRGAGHHIGSANPGTRGNCIISAHNDIYGEIFRRLPEMEVGDVIEVYTTGGQVYRYVATQIRIIEPTDLSVMYPTSTPVLTLISCYPYGIDTQRIVVIAELQP
ncbi:MAG: class D sortase [Anaerolineae bacterium]|nr:class D sortase [Anaerolineae bacterium]